MIPQFSVTDRDRFIEGLDYLEVERLIRIAYRVMIKTLCLTGYPSGRQPK